MCWKIFLYSQNIFVFLITHNINSVKWQCFDMLSRLCLQLIGTSTDLCEEIKIHTERTNYIKLHVCELDYILVIFCMNCLFHRIHVCQMTWRAASGTISCGRWLSNMLCSSQEWCLRESKVSSLWACRFAPTSHTARVSIWYMNCQCIMLYTGTAHLFVGFD